MIIFGYWKKFDNRFWALIQILPSSKSGASRGKIIDENIDK